MLVDNPHAANVMAAEFLNKGTSTPYTLKVNGGETIPYYQAVKGAKFTNNENYNFPLDGPQPEFT
jgi:hypothetical protein